MTSQLTVAELTALLRRRKTDDTNAGFPDFIVNAGLLRYANDLIQFAGVSPEVVLEARKILANDE